MTPPKLPILALLLLLSFTASCACTLNAGNNVSVCQNSPLSITATATGGPSVAWSSTPSNIISAGGSTLTVTINTSAAPATYTLIINGNAGQCADTVLVTIKPLPTASISPATVTVCNGASVTLTASGGGTYVWSNALGTNAAATFNASSTTTYTVTVTGANNCTASASRLVTVNAIPTAAITGTNTICSGTSTALTASGGGTYVWSNSLGTNATVTVSPPSTTTYTVTVTTNGCTATATRTVTVNPKTDAAIADYNSIVPFAICGDSLYASNISSTVANNSSYKFSWGDGNTTTVSSANYPLNGVVSHNYATPGYFTVLLTVTGTNTCTDTSTYTVYQGSNPGVGLGGPGSTIEQCIPAIDTFTFSQLNIANNPPGTTYTVTFNDGSPPVVYSHPPPASFTHTFSSSSCGAVGANTPNSFYVRVRAENPCGYFDAGVEPITTATRPDANFTISPDTIVCITSTVTFTNTSIDGVVVHNNGVCDSINKRNWFISPATYTVVSGALGLANPNNNQATWGSNVLGVSFTAAGTYSITLIIRNNFTIGSSNNISCGNDTITKTICVQGPPTPSFTATPQIGCAPLLDTLTSTSTNLPLCGPLTRLWTISKTGSTCPPDSILDFTYTTGNQNSQSPIIRFNNQGTYTITLSLTNICGTFTTPTQTITINRRPIASLALISPVCIGTLVTPTLTTSICGSAITNYSWAFPGAIPSTSNIANPTNINYTVTGNQTISVTVTNSCGTATASTTVNILPLPSSNAGPDDTVCLNAPPTIQLNGTPAGGTWSGSSQITSGGLFTTSQLGTFNLIYTVTAAGCSRADTVRIFVSPLPTISIIPTAPIICIGDSVNLTASGANTYSWSPSTGLNATNLATVKAKPLATTTYTVTGTNTTTGCVNTATVTVTVNPLPVVSAGPDTTLCNQPIPVTLVGTPAGGTWSLSGITSGGVFTPATTGNFPVRYCYTNGNNCSKCDTAIISVINPSNANAGPNDTVCLNFPPTVQLSGSPAGGTWSGNITPGGLFTTSTAGSFNLVYTYGGGSCVSRDTMRMLVNPLPNVVINPSPATICLGDSVTLTASGANTYSWSPATGLNVTNLATVKAKPTVSTVYTVTGTNTITGCVNTATVTVNVNPLPVVSAGPDTILCNQPIPITLIGTPSGGTWSLSGITSVGVFTPTTTGSFPVRYCYTNGNNCSKCDTAFVTVINPTNANAGPDDTVCLNLPTTVQLNGLPAGGTWSGNITPGGLFTTSTAGTFNLVYTYGAGTCVRRDTMRMLVNPLPNVVINPSPATICLGDSVNLTASGANTYSWSPATGLNATNLATVKAKPLVTTTYTVTGTNTTTGCVNTAIVTVTVNPLPVVSAGPDTILCNQPIPITLLGSPSGGTWSLSGITSTGVFTPTTTGSFPVRYCYTDGNNCSKCDTAIVTVINPTNANAGADDTVCLNLPPTVQLTGLPAGGTWSGNITSGGLFTTSTAGTFNLVYTYGAGTCVRRDTMRMLVNPLPNVVVNPSPATICAGDSVNLTASGANTYSWSPATGLNATNIASVKAKPILTTVYTVTGTNTITGCVNTAMVTVNVNPLPVVNAGPDTTLCNQPIPITLVGSPLGGTWSGTPNITTGGVFTPNGNGIFTVRYCYTNANNCSKCDTTIVSVINPSNANAGLDDTVCLNLPPTVQLTGLPAGGSWSGNITTGGLFTTSTAGTFNLVYTYGGGTCISRDTMRMLVNPLPNVVINPSPATICFGDSVNLTASGANTYSWSPATGLNATNIAVVKAKPIVTTIYTVTGTNTITGCVNTATVTVNVNPLPVVNAGPDTILCNQPIPVTLVGSPLGGTWSLSGITSGGVFTPNATGTFPVKYCYTDGNGCTKCDTAIITVINPTNANAGADDTACLNLPPTIQLVGLPAGGTWGGNITPGGLFTTSTAGTFNLVYTYGAGTCIRRDTMGMLVNPLPNVVINPSPVTICFGDSVNLTASGANTYSWSPATGLSATNIAVVKAKPIVTTIYTVTGTNTSTGCVNTSTVTVNVNPLPVVSAGPDTTLCNQPIPVTLVGSPLGGTWSLSGITSGGVFTPNATGTFPVKYCFTDGNGCTKCDTAIITVINPTNANAGADDTACVNNPATIQLTGLPAGGTWSGNISPGGLFTTSTAGTFNLVYIYGAGTCIRRDTMNMLVNPLPNLTVTPAIPAICFDDSVTLTASGANTYTWTPNTFLTASTGAIVIAFPPITTTYTVTGIITATGCANSINTIVNVSPRPVITNNPLLDTICSGDYTSTVIFTSTVLGTTYSWPAPTSIDGVSGLPLIGGSGNITPQQFSVGTLTGHVTYHVTPTANGCPGTPVDYVFTVNPVPVPVLPAPQTICSCDTTAPGIISSNILSASISWTATFPSSITLPTQFGSGNIPGQIICNSSNSPQQVIFHVTAALNGCDSTRDYIVTVNPSPTVIFTPGPQIICSGQTAVADTITSSTPNANISWSAAVPSGIHPASTIGTNVIPSVTLYNDSTFPQTITYTAIATTTGLACPGVARTTTITINPTPDVIVTPTSDTICSLTQINIQISSSVAGATFAWTPTAPPSITGENSGAGTTITDTLDNHDSIPHMVIYNITATGITGCPGLSISVPIIVYPTPAVAFNPLSPIAICDSATTPQVQITSSTAGVNISWHSIYPLSITGALDSGLTIIPPQTLYNNSNTIQQVIYNVTVGYLGCPGTGNSYIVNVNPTPHITNTDTLQSACSDDSTTTIILLSDVTNSTFTWSTIGNANLSGYDTSGVGNIPPQTISNVTNQAQSITYIAIPNFAGCDGVPQEFIITINPRPVMDLMPDSQSICSNTFTAPIICTSNVVGTIFTLMSAIDSVSGELSSMTGDTIPSHPLHNTSTQASIGYVWYMVTATSGTCVGDIDTAFIQVNPTPVIHFSMNQNYGCSPLHVDFTTNPFIFGTPDNLVFNWGDGTSDTIYPNPIQPIWSTLHHAFVNDTFHAVTFLISLTATNNCGSTTVYDSVTVQPNIIDAALTPSTTHGCEPLTVLFANNSTGSLVNTWSFNYDSATQIFQQPIVIDSTGDTITHTFLAGTYLVALYITNGCSQDTAFVRINVDPAPTVDFIYTDSVCVNVPVIFTDQSIPTGGQTLSGYNWQFGDGHTSDSINTIHTYDSTGIYNACHTVTSSNGCLNTQCHPVTILATPQVDFTANDTCLNTQPIQFTNTTSSGNYFYQWNFGDANTAVGQNPTHSYQQSGTYSVTLTASTNYCSHSITHPVIIHPIPDASFTLPSTYACGEPAMIAITNTSTTSVGVLGYAWDFGNGTTSTDVNPMATFATAGTYTITLVASNQFLCQDSAQHPITIYPFPTIQSVDLQPEEGCQPLVVTLTANTTNGNLFLWNFGDGTSTVSTNSSTVSYTYQDTGTYSVSLTVYSFLTCGDTIMLLDTVKVHITPKADFDTLINSSGYPFDGTVAFINQSQNANSYEWNFGDGFSSIEVNPIHKYEEVDSFTVTLIAATTYPCYDTISKTFFVIKKALYVPNALAPAYGGMDTLIKIWKPIGIGLRDYHAQVFDKWGRLLWESDSLVETKPALGWDGTYSGIPCQEDVYVWKVDGVFLDGEIWPGMTYRKDEGGGIKRIGSITLVR